MTNSELTEMPWGLIFKRTVQYAASFAAAALVLLTGLSAAELKQQRHERAESERPRWTDKNRWE